MADFDESPLVYAIDASGALKHVDSVPNGAACECRCPFCGQPLIAKNCGTRMVHHFAHRRASCKWAAEKTIALISNDILSKEGYMLVEGAGYLDTERWRWVYFSPAGQLEVISVDDDSGERNDVPALTVACVDEEGAECEFSLVALLTRELSEEQIERLSKGGRPVLAIDFKAEYSSMRGREGRHFSRGEFLAKAQDPGKIRSILIDGDCSRMLAWVSHPRRDKEQAECEERENRRLREECEARLEKAMLEAEQEKAESERKRIDEKRREDKRMKLEIRAEVECFAEEGVEALMKVREGVSFYVDGCPLYGKADVVVDCGCYSWSSDKCIFFEGQRYHTIGCTARQNGVGLE